VHARRAGHAVTLFEMSARLGGRARGVPVGDGVLDNGQHILIGAYRATLELMQLVGADASQLLHRMPLTLQFPDGQGLRLPRGAPLPAFVRGVLGARGWSWGDRLALLRAASGWALRGFQCDTRWSVAQLCAKLPATLREQLIDPLCVAALNTPAAEASASVFLRVLHDALFSGAGSADLLLPRASLDALLPRPAAAWLNAQGVAAQTGRRVVRLQPRGAGWLVDGTAFDAVVLACSAAEAARLCAPLAPAWAEAAAALRYEPIVTVFAHSEGARLPAPMIALHAGATAPAQFVFDLGALSGKAGLFAFVVSGARRWVEKGLQATAMATLAQAEAAFGAGTWTNPLNLFHVSAEKRATFRCTPGLVRPAAKVAAGLFAAGDYLDGPYPATLEGAVLSGLQAVRLLDAA
jgi:squalene-associated FAD-dependent desaturase